MKRKAQTISRELKADETLLWNKVTRTITPMRPNKIANKEIEDLQAEMAAAMVPNIKSQPITAVGLKAAKTAAQSAKIVNLAAPITSPKRTPSPAPIAAHIDKPVYRKIAKGRVSIDARIDLHNLTQQQAIGRLHGFLSQAYDLGHRHVLVITGKGGSPTSEGVLRRMLPVWLNTPAFSHIVNGYQSAARDHGGEGAFYVRLRRQR